MNRTRRCVLCMEWRELSAACFALTKRGFAYLCVECKRLDNAIRYRKKRLRCGAYVEPYSVQERKIIIGALQVCCGDVTMAALRLQIGRATIYRKLRQYQDAGGVTELELASMKIIGNELAELIETWDRLRRRARIIRKREARKREFERRLDRVIAEVSHERTEREAALERLNRDAVREAQRHEAERRASKLSAVALRADVDQGLAGSARLPQESRGSAHG